MSSSDLPIQEIQPALCSALQEDGVALILQAPTGSGKSTQVPQMLVDAGLRGDIVVLQPRRIAARMLAQRVATERHCKLGDEVGYQVRFEKVTSSQTRIKFVTEGILLRQMLSDPALARVGAVIFDEFHERHLDADIGLAQCRQLQQTKRPDLKLVVMSATLETAALETFLEPSRVLQSDGRTHPVEIRYRPQGGRDTPLWEKMTKASREAVGQEKHEGHVLMFLPGSFEIQKTCEALKREKWARDVDILPLYGDLSPQQQDAAVAPSTRRKIIVATNVAETSLTIDGVRIVIDSGLARVPNFDPVRGLNTLTIDAISQASSDQRAGRAGRTAPGICVRLWGEAQHRQRAPHVTPEVHRLDLAETVLHLKTLGMIDLNIFDWFEAPSPVTLKRAVQLLIDLQAIDAETQAITDMGKRMADFPVSPRYGRVLVEAEQRDDDGQSWLVACLLVALSEGRPILPKGKGGQAARARFVERQDDSDFLPLLRAYQSAASCRFQLDQCRQLGVHAGAAREVDRLFRILLRRGGFNDVPRQGFDSMGLADLLLPAFSDHIAVRCGTSSKTFDVSGGRRGQLGVDTVIESKTRFVVASELTEIEGKEINVILGCSSAVSEDDLRRHFPEAFSVKEGAGFRAEGRRVVAERQVCFRDLVLERKEAGEPPLNEAAGILAERVLTEELKLKQWNHAVESWLARIRVVREAMPELELPEFTVDDKLLVLTEVCQGAVTYKQIKDKPVLPVLKQWLSPAHRSAVETYAPEHVTLTNGVSAKVDYVTNLEPAIGVILQRLYDVKDTPAIVDGRVILKVQILAPNQRPAQVTNDLRGFWKNSYPAVKKDLMGRYPKHEWR